MFLFTWDSNLARPSLCTRGPGLQWLKLLLRGLSVDSPESSCVPSWSTGWHLCTFCAPTKLGEPWELNSGLFLLASHAKLPCLPRYGTLVWCQETLRSFIGVLEFGGLLPLLPTPLPCFLLLPASLFKSTWKRRFLLRSYMMFSFLWRPNSRLAATAESTFSLYKDEFSDLHSPALVLLMSEVERKRSGKPSQGNSLALTSYFVTALLLQNPIQCQVLNILFSFFLTCLCSRLVVPIARRILLVRQAIMNSEEQQKKNHINKSFAVPHYMTSRGTVWPRRVYWSVVPPFSLLRGFLYDHLLWRTLCPEILRG